MEKLNRLLFLVIFGFSMNTAVYAATVTIADLQADVATDRTDITADAAAVTSARAPLPGLLATYKAAEAVVKADKTNGATAAQKKADKAAEAAAKKAEKTALTALNKAYGVEINGKHTNGKLVTAGYAQLISNENKLVTKYDAEKPKDTADAATVKAQIVTDKASEKAVKTQKTDDNKSTEKGGFTINAQS